MCSLGSSGTFLAYCWKPLADPREVTSEVLPTIFRYKAQLSYNSFSHAKLMLSLLQQSCEIGVAVTPTAS